MNTAKIATKYKNTSTFFINLLNRSTSIELLFRGATRLVLGPTLFSVFIDNIAPIEINY